MEFSLVLVIYHDRNIEATSSVAGSAGPKLVPEAR
jgi:hypothetical protein